MLGSYRVRSLIGEGGMGAVYLAEHEAIERKAAVKILHPEVAANPRSVERFFNEAKAANRVGHPNIVDIYDFGHSPLVGAYLVMEYLEGENLTQRLDREHPLSEAVAARIAQRVASALGAAHERGVIHRDLKPDNIFLTPDPDHPDESRVKVLDFGIAKLTLGAPSNVQTRTGAVMGTPVYMSPEQCDGARDVDARADIYSLGVILYEMLCGRPPFIADGFGQLVSMHLHAPPPPLSHFNPDVTPMVAEVIHRALAKIPSLRFPSMAAFSAAIGSAVDGTAVAETAAHAPMELSVTSQVTLAMQGLAPQTPIQDAETMMLADVGPASREAATELLRAARRRAELTEGREPLAQTTLSGGAGEVGPAQTESVRAWARANRLPRHLVATVAALGLSIAFFSWFFLFVDDGAPFGSRDRSGETAPADRADPPPEDRLEKTETASATAAATEVILRVDSEPSGATIYRALDGVKLGATPHRLELPRGAGEIELVLRKADHEDARIGLSTLADGERMVKLVPATGRHRKGRTGDRTEAPRTAAPKTAAPKPEKPEKSKTAAPKTAKPKTAKPKPSDEDDLPVID